MDPVFQSLLILMAVIWLVAVLLRRIGFPTIMGELVGGVVVGPAVLGWVSPSEIIEVLAQMGIFFLMLHAGIETNPRHFISAVRESWGVSIIGAIAPFAAGMGIGLAFGLSMTAAIFVGLTMTATAVVITIKALQELGLQNTHFARIIVASCVIDDLITLIVFSMLLGVLSGEDLNAGEMLLTTAKVGLFFGTSFFIGYYCYPWLKHPFRHPEGKGFTFILVLALGAGLFAEAIGLHIIIGAYLAGLFFEIEVADPELIRIVKDRVYGIAYSFLGPIFFISLGFNITFDVLTGPGLWFVLALTLAVIISQIISSGGMARRLNLTWAESLSVGVGHCARAEMAFILASLGLSMNVIDNQVFSVVIFTAFLLNLFTPFGLKGCALLMKKAD
jgi:Kef-type K+ transport system membrane component KefB